MIDRVCWRTVLLIWALTLLTSAPVFAQTAGAGCRESARHVYVAAPNLVYEGLRDSLYTLVTDWQQTCGFNEPALRLSILAAIWDEAFDESIYDVSIIDALIWRYDEGRQRRPKGEVDPDWAPGGIATEADFAPGIEAFDTFTTDFADQLLPHVPESSPEQFFCLFYSGRQDQAWALLEGRELGGTDLRWYHQRELSLLNNPEPRPFFEIVAGQYVPEGQITRFGDHASVGLLLGMRHNRWLVRGLIEMRIGRSRYPYFVDDDGLTGYSDRFNNVLLGVEAGRELLVWGRHGLDVFGGIAYDTISPFQDEDYNLWGLSFLYGVGYRLNLGGAQGWTVGFDYRREDSTPRNSEGSVLDGPSFTWRIAIGMRDGGGDDRRRAALGR